MDYKVSYRQPEKGFIDIECIIKNLKEDTIELILPNWRPGRYELSNFAKNIQQWSVSDLKGNELAYSKLTINKWKVELNGTKDIKICYNYYAKNLNAGSTYLDENQLYVNPVNCFIYVKDQINDPCKLKLDIPKDYRVATSLSYSRGAYSARDFHELVDSPFIASNSLQSATFIYESKKFYLWFQGICKPNFKRLKKDFEGFVKVQHKMMKTFPFSNYHFLFQILPTPFYHGVEHTESTVIALGPGYKVMKPELYDELMGVSSHELFHAWNIKTIRPVEMSPYNYEKENYSPLGYVAEGVTTYYGDLFLYRSKFFDDIRYFKNLNTTLMRHFHNFGRQNKSLAESSLETWLDGYVKGVPDRKVSIYTEGSLFALITDVFIRRNTDNKKSLDDVLRKLYQSARKGMSYSDEDYQILVGKIAGKSPIRLFDNYVWGKQSMRNELKKALAYLGLDYKTVSSTSCSELNYGFKIDTKLNVLAIHPNSPAEEGTITHNDRIISINGIRVTDKNIFENWLEFSENEDVILQIERNSIMNSLTLKSSKKKFYQNYEIFKINSPSKEQVKAFEKWSHK